MYISKRYLQCNVNFHLFGMKVFRGTYLWTEVAIKKMIIPDDNNGLVKYYKREITLLKYVP